MQKKVVSGIMLKLLLIGMLTLAFNIQQVKADWTWTETIYIRADGSVDPDTAPISSVDNITYTLTDNIVGDVPEEKEMIVVGRNNIVVDGAGYTLQGIGSGTGIDLSWRSNVTIKNMEINLFYRGIYLFYSSNYNSISGNNITNNLYGIWFDGSSNNTLRNNDASNNEYNFDVYGSSLSHYIQDIDDSNTVNGKPVYYWVNRRDMAVPLDAGWIALINCTRMTVKSQNLTNNRQGVLLAFTTNSTITKNNITMNGDGIYLYESPNNTVSGNDITENNEYGISLSGSSNNTISGNNITNNEYGISLSGSSNNTISGNNITNNRDGISLSGSSNNIISGNNITRNTICISLSGSSNNTISGNNIANNGAGGIIGITLEIASYNEIWGNNVTNNGWYGIFLYGSSNNRISGNNIANNLQGISIAHASDNKFYHNNFIDNSWQVYIGESVYANFWDDDYPSGGNYWSDHVTVDDCCGINQDEPGSDGIVDEPYIIDDYNLDNYPLVEPWSPLPRTIGELKNEIEKCWSEGEIDNQGIVKSLLAKLNVAQKLIDKGKVDEAKSILEDDFIPQVQNLSGIHITIEAADILIQSAEYIISHL